MVKLPYVHSPRDRHGKQRHYFRKAGLKRVPLPGPPSSAEFLAAYQAALAGESAPRIEIGVSRSEPGSVAAAVVIYYQSMSFGSLGPATKQVRRRILDRFRDEWGGNRLATLERWKVEDWLSEKIKHPHAAKHFLNALRAMMAVAIAAGLRPDDPTEGLKVRAPKSSGFRTWSERDIEQFEARHAIGTRARLAFALLLYTGQRRGDIIRMGHQHVRDRSVAVRQQKTGAVLEIPLHPALAEAIAAHPAGQLTFLTTAAGKPFSAQGFTAWFRAMVREAGLPPGLSAHGLRKAMCRRLAESGCSANQIASISGHLSLREVARYTAAADQKRMAVDAMAALTGTKENARSVKLAAATVKPLPKPLKIRDCK
ncbi:MAG: tyrosine-type recombinase/integrase [Methylocella sp.]